MNPVDPMAPYTRVKKPEDGQSRSIHRKVCFGRTPSLVRRVLTDVLEQVVAIVYLQRVDDDDDDDDDDNDDDDDKDNEDDDDDDNGDDDVD